MDIARLDGLVPFRDIEEGFVVPCGSCRQTLAEFGLNLQVYLLNPSNEMRSHKLSDLLPHAFTPLDLEKARANNHTSG
jgi:cytidine deaminase